MNIYKSTGILSGILLGLIICFIVFKFANNNHKAKTEYDERQKAVRGRGYMYGFYAMMIYEAIMICASMSGVTIPAAPIAIHFTGIVLGGLVLSSYCIWNDAFIYVQVR